ncbi:hypothetical protein ACQEVB_06655 [Pseudonocardia sp. CA-107938]|uniref:hypothetical protein n=1 Tax=Pseudonocardia sp. CA-107938 TaxID=3240021 RepID=UPI003D8EA1F5
MKRWFVLLSCAAVVTCSGCSAPIAGSPVAERGTTSTSQTAALADPEGRFYTAPVPSGLVDATKLVRWSEGKHAVLTPRASPQDAQNYITIRLDPVLKGDLAAIERQLAHPQVIMKDAPPMRYARKAVDGRESIVQDIGPAAAPKDPRVMVTQRVFYIPSKTGQGPPVTVACRWTDADKALAEAVESGCGTLIDRIRLK